MAAVCTWEAETGATQKNKPASGGSRPFKGGQAGLLRCPLHAGPGHIGACRASGAKLGSGFTGCAMEHP